MDDVCQIRSVARLSIDNEHCNGKDILILIIKNEKNLLITYFEGYRVML